MTIAVEPIDEPSVAVSLHKDLTASLAEWFGRPEANACYARGIAARDAYRGLIDGAPLALMVLENYFGVTCNIWWLGVHPTAHGSRLGRALIDRSAHEARARDCRQLAVETVSPRAGSPAYDWTRQFYEAAGFRPFIAFQPNPGDYIMWMQRAL